MHAMKFYNYYLIVSSDPTSYHRIHTHTHTIENSAVQLFLPKTEFFATISGSARFRMCRVSCCGVALRASVLFVQLNRQKKISLHIPIHIYIYKLHNTNEMNAIVLLLTVNENATDQSASTHSHKYTHTCACNYFISECLSVRTPYDI